MEYITIVTPGSSSIIFQGYQFDRLTNIFLSSADIEFPSLSSIDWYTSLRRVSAICPSFTGYNYPKNYFNILDPNRLQFSTAGIDAITGTFDIIFANKAGYVKISDNNILFNIVFTDTAVLSLSNDLVITLDGDYIASI